ncbi:MAG: ABC transporter permease [Candidatus Diapherotrites archaeon]
MLGISFSNITKSKTRTLLSLIGIVIGVAAIIVMVATVQGQLEEIQDVFSKVQGIRVTPVNLMQTFVPSLDLEWADKLESIRGVKVAVPIISGILTSVDGKDITLSPLKFIAPDPYKFARAGDVGIGGEVPRDKGRTLEVGDTGVAVIGASIADNFDKTVGSTIKLQETKFRVVGIFSSGSALLDGLILISLEDGRKLLKADAGKVSAFVVAANNPEEEAKVARLIEFRYGEEVAAIQTNSLADQFGEFILIFEALVGAIAAIAAVVAGVGIINTMLMSVVERFKEIGALKATGWTNDSVLKMILYESILISIIGGLLGAIIGVSISVLIDISFGLRVSFTLAGVPYLLIVIAFLFAVFVGLIAGLYPAWVASNMDPIEALRAE